MARYDGPSVGGAISSGNSVPSFSSVLPNNTETITNDSTPKAAKTDFNIFGDKDKMAELANNASAVIGNLLGGSMGTNDASSADSAYIG